MPEIDLEPREYRPIQFRGNKRLHTVFLRGAVMAAVWFVIVVIFGRYADHGQPWYVIAAAAFAPLVMLFYVAISLDD